MNMPLKPVKSFVSLGESNWKKILLISSSSYENDDRFKSKKVIDMFLETSMTYF